MAISKGNRNHLTTFLKDYFANNRTSSAFEIVVTRKWMPSVISRGTFYLSLKMMDGYL